MSKTALGLIGQTASYESIGPYVDGLGTGTAKIGHRTCAAAYAAGDLANGAQVIILIEDSANNRTIWKALYDHSNTRFSRVSLLTTVGSSIIDEAAVDVYIADVYPESVDLEFMQAILMGAMI